jgi:amino acid adenylation domain-containing protein/non-ribosomal peptide synthase protein (TIGR01720 family)
MTSRFSSGPADPESPAPLSHGQEALWFLDRMAPGNAAYNLVAAARVSVAGGPLDAAALERAFRLLAARHPELRATFAAGASGGPGKEIHQRLDPDVQVVDATGWSEREIADRLAAEARRPFDLENGPLLRAILLTGAGSPRLLIAVHHIAADFWSLGIIARELGPLYARGTAADLPAPRSSYGDHVQRERERLAGPRGERLWNFWRERLAGVPDLDLPGDRPRPASPIHAGGSAAFRLDAALTAGLQSLSQRHGATLFAALLTGFQAFLARTAGQTGFAVGVPAAGRSSAAFEGTVGYFVQPLALRADLTGEPTVEELLERTRRTLREGLAHQAFPFPLLAERLRPVRVPGRSPLVQAMLNFHQARRNGEETFPEFVIGRAGTCLQLGELTLEAIALPPRGVPFDLTLTLAEESGPEAGLAAVLDYSADLFDATTARRLADRFARLLAAMVADPARAVDDLPLLGEAERHQVLAEWNDTGRAPASAGLYERFAAQAERTPDATAVVGQDGADDNRITYRELDRRARELAGHLRRLGVGPERVVGVFLDRTPDMVASLLGVLAAGGAYLPLDVAHPAARLEMLHDEAQAVLTITREGLRDRLPAMGQVMCLEDLPPSPGGWEGMGEGGQGGEALAYVLYTSGSTGRPKGVAVTHGSVAALLDWVSSSFSSEELAGVFAATSTSFDLSVFELFAPLTTGGAVILGDNPLALQGLAAAGEVTLVNTVPSAMAELLRQGPLPGSVRTVALAGEPLRGELARRVLAAGHVRLLNLFGPTEDTVYSTASTVDESGEPSIGRPLPGSRAYVLDAAMAPCPIGVAGELWLAGEGLARGYLHRAGQTAERFLPDPFSPAGGRLYRTGDRARLRADGTLELLGRIDQQVKVRGVRIELGEVEAALLRQPSVREAAAGIRGDGAERALVAWVVPVPGAGGAAWKAELRAALGASLPGAMVPSRWVELAALPRTPGGKIDRPGLPEPDSDSGSDRGTTGPRDPVEEALAALFGEVLGVPAVGVDESFFELGGHSLLAMRLLARVRQAFGVELTVQTVFERPTVALLAKVVEDGASTHPGRPRGVPDGIPRTAPTKGVLPVSPAQERIWFLDRLAPGLAVYNLPGAFLVRGPLQPDLLAWAFGELTRRHEALRTRFVAVAGQPVQEIDPPGPFSLPRIDLSELPEDGRAGEQRRIAREEARRPFDLERGPVLRAALVRLEMEEHLLLVSAHHIAADGWSMGLMAREIAELVRTRTPLPALPIQYADYAIWEREESADEAFAARLAAWCDRLAGAPLLFDLPTDRPRPAVQSFRGGRRPLTLPPGLGAGLPGVTPFMVLTAALQTVLGRWTGSDDLLLGTPVANRRRVETEPLIGLFVNTLVLRGDLSGDPPFGVLLERVRTTALAAYLLQDVPFERLVEALAPERSLSHSPLVQAVLVFQTTPAGTLELPGLEVLPVAVETGTAKFDLTVEVGGDAIAGSIEYRSDLFDAATIDRLAGHFATLLAGALAAPERRLSELPLLTAAEERQLAAWNAPVQMPPKTALHAGFEAWAARMPDTVAVACGDRSLTHGELNDRAGRLARTLRRLGVGPEALVGLCAERSPELLIGILGVLKAGGAYLPLDAGHPRERLAFTLDDARPAVLLTQRSLLDRLPISTARVVLLDGGAEETEEADWETAPAHPDQLAYVIYTSGSTGRPKGTLISHGNVTRLLAATAEAMEGAVRDGGTGVWTLFHSPAFDFSVWEIWGALAFGGRLVVVPSAVSRSPEDFLRLLAREGVTVLNQTPSAFLHLARAAEAAGAPELPALRLVIFGGEALEVGALASWLGRPGGLPRLVNMYGITETTVHVTWRPIEAADLAVAQRSPIGVPLPDLSVHLLDPHGRLVPVGVSGEIHVGGAGAGRGYLGRPELTAERFVPDPFSAIPGARLYRSGDLARRRPDGQLDVLGRIDQQIKIRGFRVELGEIEAALAQHPAVAAAAVSVREHDGDRRLAAFWVPREGGSTDAVTLRAFLKERLPEHMVPGSWTALRELPLTASGKVDRRRLAELRVEEESAEAADASPRTPTEEILAGLWAELLGRACGPADDFFAVGGHSLLATQLVSRVRRAFGVEIPVLALFEAPALAGLAERVDAALGKPEAAALPAIEPAPNSGPWPLSFAQRRLWLLDRLEPGGSTYNIPLAVRLTGPLDARRLEQSLGAIAGRHATLRTRFVEIGGEPMQEVQSIGQIGLIRPISPILPRIDLSALPGELRSAHLERLLQEEADQPFDLSAGPLLRAVLVQLGTDEAVLALTVHHIASDGWSTGVLVRELSALYGGGALQPLPIQYTDFAVWQRRWMSGAVLDNQLAWWRERLAGVPVLDLPTDRPRPPVQTYRGQQIPLAVPAGLWQRTGAAARRQGSTPFMMLLAALQILLARWSGQSDLSLGFPVANRRRPETEGLVGLFVNTLVLRAGLADDPTGAELLRRTRAAALGAYAHQDVPFEKLVEELRPARRLDRSPLFQVLLAHNAALPALDLAGLTAEPLEVATRTAKFDLSWLWREHGGSLAGALEYASDLFDRPTALRLAGHFERLLAGLADQIDEPERRISDLPLLSEPEAAQLAWEWIDTGEIAFAPSLPELFARQVERTPEGEALVAGTERLSYAELDRRADEIAIRLRALGVAPEIRVAVCLERSADLVAALLAVWKAGGAYVPLDPDWPRERLTWMLEDSGAAVLVGRRERVDGLAEGLPVVDPAPLEPHPPGPPLPSPSHPPGEGGTAEADGADCAGRRRPSPGGREGMGEGSGVRPPGCAPQSLAYLIYTSGSTGRPKGVAVSHANAAALACWGREAFAPEELAGVLAATSVCFDLSVFELFVTLGLGGTVILAENALALPTLPSAGAVTLINTVPSAMAELMRTDAIPASVRTVCLAGEALRRDLVDQIHLRRERPGMRVLNLYGPTEDTTYSTGAVMARGERGAPSIGRPLPGTRAFLLDRAGHRVPPGAVGELCLGGSGLARGYLGRAALTAERFVPDRWSATPGDRLYRTGDLARWRVDGNLDFLGRIDHQVKVRGFRIEPGEIEAALLRQPGVRAAVVMPRGTGEVGGPRLVAWVVPDLETPDPAVLRAALRDALPSHMVPSAVVFLDALPRTSSGKIDRAALPDPGHEERADYTAPRSPVEILLAEIWAAVLGVERVGAHDDFFALGGHSLLATQVVSRVREACGVSLSLRALFEAPILAALAGRIEEARQQGTLTSQTPPPMGRVPRDGDLPLSFSQQRLWFLEQMEPGNPNLHIAMALHLAGPLHTAALGAALGEVVRRHETLRTTFSARGGRPIQMIGPPAPAASFRLPVADLAGFPAERRRDAALREMAGAAWSPFDLARGPLLRAVLVRLRPEGDEHALLLALHHIVSDGWSNEILFTELTTLYEAFRAGRPSPLPELAVQYADFASWQRDWLHSDVLDEELAFWRTALGAHGSRSFPLLDLPTDRPRPAVPTLRGARRPLRLPPELVAALRAAGREHGATLFMVLLTAFQAFLHRTAGQDELLVGSPVANRTRVEIEKLIGMFFNLLAFRADLADDPPFSGLLARVRESALAAYLHQELPFEKLLEELQPERHLSRTPLFQVTLVLQNAPRAAVELPGLTLAPLDIGSPGANFDLNVQLTESTAGVTGWIEYRTDLFDAPTVDRMACHLRNLLAAVAADPGPHLSRLLLLSPEERFQLIHEWNDTQTLACLPSPGDRAGGAGRGAGGEGPTLHGLFAAQAARTPEAIAVVAAARSMTYAEVERESARVARRLRARGAGPGVPVAVSLERTAEMVPALLGILRTGGFYVPLDPAWPAARSAAILASLGVTHRLEGLPDEEEEKDGPEINDPEALAYVIFTSGSTGQPKGVMMQHRPVANLIGWVNRTFGVGPGDRLLFVTSLAFDLSVYDIFGVLAAGGTVRIASETEARDPEALASILSREPITFWDSAPAALGQIVPFLPAAGGDRSRLRLVFLSGDWIPLPLPGAMTGTFPGARVIALGGATEAAIWSNSYGVGALAPHWVSVPYGRPIANARYLVLGARLEPCPIGVPGDLWIGGGCLSAGYAGDPALTAAKYLPDPWGAPGGRLYRTGDRARFLPDGNLEFLGRLDHQVKIRGVRIELGEIEAALLAHPAVRGAVAVALEGDAGPRGDKRLAAYVVPNLEAGGEIEEEAPAVQVARWQEVYDAVYSRTDRTDPSYPSDSTLDLAGWISSYTGEPIPAAEMRTWVESTVERIVTSGLPEGARVLEIGCGTGMLLFRIAPRCSVYQATDLSAVSLGTIQGRLATRGLSQVVTLEQRAADDWTGIPPGSFDAVIVNSVTQHFPGAGYLRRVVEGAVQAVGPGGFVFVGDVRSLPLLRAFHASVQLAQAPDGLNRGQLDRRVRQRAAQEEELLVDPRFFTSLAAELPAVERAEIQLKRGRDRNEMTRFRFDAVLHLGSGSSASPETRWTDWTALPRLHNLLAEQPAALGVRGIPDGRLQSERTILGWLEGSALPETAGSLRNLLDQVSGQDIEPEDLWKIGRDLGYTVEVRNAAEVGFCDALFSTIPPSPGGWEGVGEGGQGGEATNDPLRGVLARKLIPRLRAWLAERLPEAMIPAAIIPLDALPLTANGKVDRKALPAPDSARPDLEEDLVAPRTPAERRLAAIWSEVLGVERVGVHDNFFSLGGDSILSIQVIARAQQAGLRLTPRQLFQHQTVAELAAAALEEEAPDERAEQGPVTGPVPLTPIQRWLFAQELADLQHWNLAVMLELREAVRPEHLHRAVGLLLDHHDALRLRFRREAAGWMQWNDPPSSSIPSAPDIAFDLSALPAPALKAALESAAEDLQRSLDLENGPLQRFALFRGAPGEADRLLVIIHHLTVDVVSWRILLEDLQTLLRQLARGEEPRLPAKTTSYRRWAESLAAQTGAAETLWDGGPRELPGNLGGPNVEGLARTVDIALDDAETEALLREVPAAFQTRIDDVLLTALARAFARWTGSRSLLLDLEGHGRDLQPDLDLSRTVGWFTDIHPVLLETGAGAPEEDLKTIKEQLRKPTMEALSGTQVIFNNLGQLGALGGEGAMFRPTDEPTGAQRSPRARRRHVLGVYANLFAGRLELRFEYSTGVHSEATIRGLAEGFLDALRELIERCRAAGAAGAGGFTPSDFPESDLDQEDLDLLLAELA